MTVHTGRVVDGQVVVDGDPLPEGAELAIQILDENAPFHLTPEMQAELDESIAQADRGEGVDGYELLEELRALDRRQS